MRINISLTHTHLWYAYLLCLEMIATSQLFSVVADRLKTALSRIAQDCDQWIKPQVASSSSSSPTSLSSSYTQMDVTPTSPVSTNVGQGPTTSFGLKVFIFTLTKVCYA